MRSSALARPSPAPPQACDLDERAPRTVGAALFAALFAALVGVGVFVKMKAKKPPASTGGDQALGGVTLSAPAQSPDAANANPLTTSKVEVHLEFV